MADKRKHIISKLCWRTSFDIKSKGSECQNKLSNWSHYMMPGELDTVLDQYSMPGKVWQIDQLELDIGPVSYLYLEEELSVKIKAELKAKLDDLLQDRQVSHNSPGMQVKDELQSNLELLHAFLLYGILPWNHTGDGLTINQLFTNLLMADSEELVHMLKRLAVNNKQVTRRIAWQVSEPHIISIVHEIEPANAKMITGFVHDMVLKQEKETIVHATTREFKTNLWYWVLDYLFTNHGSVFNKKEFIKRSLRQLAAHYNIHYDKLVSTIKNLVQKYDGSDSTDNLIELLSTIALDEEPSRSVNNSFDDEDAAKDRERLLNYFRNYHHPLANEKRSDFNQLVVKLSNERQQAFANLVHSLSNDALLRDHAIQHLGNDALEPIVKAYHNEIASEVLNYVRILLLVPSLRPIRDDIWKVCIGYIIKKKNSELDKDDLLRHLIRELKLTQELLVDAIPAEHKVPLLAEKYCELKDALLFYEEKQDAKEKHLFKLIWEASSVHHANKRNAAAIQLLHCIQREPAAVIKLLHKYPDHDQLKIALHATLNYTVAKQILEQFSDDKAELFRLLNISSLGDEYWINDLVKEVVIEIIVNKEKKLAVLGNVIADFAGERGLRLLHGKAQTIRTIDEIIGLIHSGKTDKANICRLLSTFFQQASKSEQELSAENRYTILHYLTPRSSALYNDVISRYEGEAQIKMIRIFWRLLLDYKTHFGRINVLESLIERAKRVDTAFTHLTIKEDALFSLKDEKLIEELFQSLIVDKRIPVWVKCYSHRSYSIDLLNEIVICYEQYFLAYLKSRSLTTVQAEWLAAALSMKTLVTIAARSYPAQQSALTLAADFYHSLVQKKWGKEMQCRLAIMIMEACVNGDWRMITAENIWKETIWELVTKHAVQYKQVIITIDKDKSDLPLSMIQAFNKLKKINTAIAKRPVKPFVYSKIPYPAKKDGLTKAGVTIYNAGLVLINSYMLLLFDRLGLTASNQFISEAAKLEAIHSLQYIVTGKERADESLLPLNKVLCGVDMAEPVPAEIAITGNAKGTIEGLIKALIGYWPAIGQTSIGGFRGNWLVRKGVLTEGEEKWELNIEKRSYDLLLAKSPFSFSIIKFPWMKKPVHVNWAY